jgi:hypothetical protein
VQATIDQLLEGDTVVLGDSGEANVDLVLVVLGPEVDCGARFGHRSQPVLSGDMGGIFHQFNDALSGATFAG